MYLIVGGIIRQKRGAGLTVGGGYELSAEVFEENAARKNKTEAGHARAKAEADIALSLPAEYRD